MARVKRYLLLLAFYFVTSELIAQNITGTWEGEMNDEFLQINVEQKGKQLCGYTYDVVLENRRSYCKAYFTGSYDEETGIWTINGVSFIDNSGSHVLMTLRLWQPNKKENKVLRGIVTTRSSFSDILNLDDGDRFTVRKVSAKPTRIPGKRSPCEEEVSAPRRATIKKAPPKKSTSTPPPPVVQKAPTPKPVVKAPVVKPPVKKAPVTVKRNPLPAPPAKDTLRKNQGIPDPVTPPVQISRKEESLVKQMSARKKTEMSRVEVNVKTIELKVYDNGIVDNDTVSIFYNGKLLRSKQRLSEDPIIIKLSLDESSSRHELIMFAENLGSIPPNTAIIVVTAGDKRYELRSSASLEENAVLVFDYKPK